MATVSDRKTFALSEDELEKFDREGFIGPVKLYEPEEMTERWNSIRRQLPDRSLAIYPEGAGKASSISNYDRHLDIDLLSEHIIKPEIVDRLSSVLGPDLLCWRSEFFPKFPGDEGTDWHQAATFAHASGSPQILWPSEDGRPAFGGTITVWTAFTHSTKQNGCLQLMPGTHRYMNYDESKGMAYEAEAFNKREKDGVKRGFFGYDYRQLQKDPNWKPDESQAFPLVMKPGEAVIFWSTLMHASLPHTGDKKDYRMGYAARYVPTQVQVYPGTSEVNEYGGGITLDRYGAVLVAGEDAYGHNRIARESQRGFKFVPHHAAPSDSALKGCGVTGIPLIMIHHAGGSSSVFAPLVKALPPGLTPILIDLPGRGRRWREALRTDASDAIDDLVSQVDGVAGDIAILGHSLGAYLGLGLAARLERRRRVCVNLFASANAGPLAAELPLVKPALDCTDDEIFEVAAASGGGVDPNIIQNEQLRSRTADLLRADFSLSQTFLASQRRTVTEAGIAVCCGTDDVFTDAQLARWAENTTGQATVARFPGGHFYLSEPAVAASLARLLTAELLAKAAR